MSFHLINISDERTWPKNQKILFLGEWCLKNSRKKKWENLDYILCKPHLSIKKDRETSVEEIFNLVKKFLPKVVIALNQFHQTNFSNRYWQILIGHWLIRFISTVHNRYYTLQNALDNYDISKVTFLQSKDYKLASLDTLSSIYSTNCEVWNNMIFSKLYNYFGNKKIKVNYVNISDKNFSNSNLIKQEFSFKQNIKKILIDLSSKITRDKDAVIHGSYLSIINEIKLNLFFRQFPFQCNEIKNDFTFKFERKDLSFFNEASDKSLFQFLNKTIFSAIPVVYVENFSKVQSIINNLKWPKNPKFIFTSSSFDTDEIFKQWVAKNVENSVPYFVGQHGNSYGQHIFYGRSIWPERSTSDSFITWGWDDGFKSTVSGFNFKKKIHKNKTLNKKGLVLITTCANYRFNPWDVVNEYKKNLNEQYIFLKNLSKSIFEQTTIRLHNNSLLQNDIDLFNEKENLKKKFPYLKIDDGLIKLQTLVNKNKFFVFSYDGTGILEFLHSDIPFIAFWPKGSNNIIEDKEILNLYNEFYELGIFFRTGKEAAEVLNKKWEHIEDWWNSNDVKVAKRNFKKYFSLYKSNTYYSLGKILKNKINSVY